MAKKCWLVLLAILLCSSITTTAYGRSSRGHENCNLCHLSVEDGNYKLTIKPDVEVINPNTGEAFDENDALCMRCHKMQAKSIHPVGIVPNAQKVSLPPEAMTKDGKISCASCHDFHGENGNYRYLRWSADNGSNISKFCTAYCHTKLGAPKNAQLRLTPHLVLNK